MCAVSVDIQFVSSSPTRAVVDAAPDLQVVADPVPVVVSGFRRLVRFGATIGLRIPLVLSVAELSVLLLLGPRSVSWLVAVVLYGLLATSAGLYRSRLSVLFLDDVAGVVGRLLAAARQHTHETQHPSLLHDASPC